MDEVRRVKFRHLKVLTNREVSPLTYTLGGELDEAPRPEPMPGQFLHLKCDTGDMLYRPFSVMWAEGKKVEIFYKVFGEGSRALAGRRPGETLNLLIPLGSKFSIYQKQNRVIMVGGGVGVPPLAYLAVKLKSAFPASEIVLIIGGKDRLSLNLEFWQDFAARHYGPDLWKLELCTEDGSLGRQGLVTDILGEMRFEEFGFIYLCGPNPMTRAVQSLVGRRIPGEASVECKFACATGACLGCAIKVFPSDGDPSTDFKYKRVCVEGPVFPLHSFEI